MNIHEEWSEKLIEQLIKNARQPHILQFTPNDATRRFSSVESAKQWFTSAEKHTFPLWENDQLLGFIWFSKDTHPKLSRDIDYTFAIRMYEAGRGKGLSEAFAAATLTAMRDQYGMDSVWLETGEDNPAARHLYEKLGFETIEIEDGRVLMVQRKNPARG